MNSTIRNMLETPPWRPAPSLRIEMNRLQLAALGAAAALAVLACFAWFPRAAVPVAGAAPHTSDTSRSGEHTSELPSPCNIACRPFFLNDTAPTEISTLPLHDALPIYTEYAGAAALAPGPVASDRDEQTPTCRPGRGRRTGRTGLFRMVSTRRRSRGGRRTAYVGYIACVGYIGYIGYIGYAGCSTRRPCTAAPAHRLHLAQRDRHPAGHRCAGRRDRRDHAQPYDRRQGLFLAMEIGRAHV